MLNRRFIENSQCENTNGLATWGIESYNSKGEATDPHLHYHCRFNEEMLSERGKELTDLCAETHRKWITTEFTLKGNSEYSMKLLGDVRNEEDFFQYPVKQWYSYPEQTICGFINCTDEYNLDALKLRGNGDYERTKKQKLLALERQTNKNMFWDKLVASISEKSPTTDRNIWMSIANYYVDQGKTPPWASLDDKVLHYRVQVGLTSIENAYLAYHPATRSDGRKVRLRVVD
jgi:hypothetical protein